MRKILTSGFLDPSEFDYLELHLDSRFPNGRDGALPNDGDAISAWKDMSGNGRDAVQATSTKQPFWRKYADNLLPYRIATGNDASSLGFTAAQLDVVPSPDAYGRSAIQIQPRNQIANSSFETDTSGWTGLGENLLTSAAASFEDGTTGGWGNASGCSMVSSTDLAFDGTHSLKITRTSAGSGQISFRLNGNVYAVSPGTLYTALAYFRAASTPQPVSIGFIWFDSNGSPITTRWPGSFFADNSSSWTQARVIGVAPSGAAYVAIQPYIGTGGTNGPANGEVHYMDACGIYPTPLISGGGVNIIDNDSFEIDITGWAVYSAGSIALSTSQSYVGRQSLAITPSAGNCGAQTSGIKLPTGTQVTLSAWVYPTASNQQFRLDIAGVSVGNASAALPVNTWTRITQTFTTTSSIADIGVLNCAGTFAKFYLDAVKIEVGPSATTFTPRAYSNLVTNPSFEVDLTGWTGHGNAATAVRVTSDSYVGSASAQITWSNTAGTGNSGSFGVDFTITGGNPLLPNTTYTASCYVKVPAATTIRPYLRVEGNVVSVASSSPATNDNTWQRMSATFTTDSSADTVYVKFVVNYDSNPGSTGQSFFLDAAQVELGQQANPYVDGSCTIPWGLVSQTTIARSNVGARDGTWLAYSVVTFNPNMWGNGLSFKASLAASTTYTFSASNYSNSSGMNVVASGPGMSGVAIGTSFQGSGSWQRQSVTFTTNSSGGTVYLRVYTPIVTPTSYVQVDAVQLEVGSTAHPYYAPTANMYAYSPLVSAVPVTAGNTYTVKVSVRSAAVSRTAKVHFQWYDSSKVLLSTSTGNSAATSTTAWTDLTETTTAPANAAYAIAYLEIDSPAGIGELHYADRFGLFAGTQTTWVAPATTPNGQPTVQFDGVDDVLTGGWATDLYSDTYTDTYGAGALAQPVTYYVVFRSENPTDSTPQYVISSNNTSERADLSVASGNVSAYSGATLAGPAVSGNTHVACAVFDGATSVVSIDGVESTGDAGSSPWQDFAIGGYAGNNSNYGQISVAAVLVYSAAHDSTTRKRISRYLAGLFGVNVG